MQLADDYILIKISQKKSKNLYRALLYIYGKKNQIKLKYTLKIYGIKYPISTRIK